MIVIVSVVALFASERATAQLRSSYFMEGSYFRMEMNPALNTTRGYFALPGVGGAGVNIQSNFLSFDNLYRQYNGEYISILDSRIDAESAFSGLSEVNNMKVNAITNIIGVGFHSRKSFWSFGLNVRAQGNAILERSLFEGMRGAATSLENSTLDITGFTELYLGSSFNIFKNLTLGFRVKALFGVVNINGALTEASRGNLKGTFVFSGMPVERDEYSVFEENKVFDFSIDHLLASPANFGLALDLGLELRLFNDHLKISAAIADVGYIKWDKKQMMNVDVNSTFDANDLTPNNLFGFKRDQFEMDNSSIMAGDKANVSRMLNYSVNLGAEYNFLRNHFSVGMLLHNVFCNNKVTYQELTASFNIRPLNWITLTATHTFLGGNKPGVFGAAINIHPSVLNIFVGADFIDNRSVRCDNGALFFARPISRSIYAGVSFSMARPKSIRNAEKEVRLQRRAERKESRQQ